MNRNVLAAKSGKTMARGLSPAPGGTAYELDSGYELFDLNYAVTRGRDDILCYEVSGDSMVESIQPGSIIFVDPSKVPKSGDIVAVSVNDTTAVKQLEIKGSGLYLVSSNPAYPKRKVTASDTVYILGVVLGCLQIF